MRIAVISYGENDITRLLAQYGQITFFSPNTKEDIEGFDAYAVLGGDMDKPLNISIDVRLVIEKARADKKPVFLEWCSNIGYLCKVNRTDTVSGRMVYVGDNVQKLKKGDLLDDHDNSYIGADLDRVARHRARRL